jgi:hypothetical protein
MAARLPFKRLRRTAHEVTVVTMHRLLAVLTLILCAAGAQAAAAGAPASDRYFRMKQVKIIDQGMNQEPAIDLMIPTTWQFQGEIRYGGGVGGCFADMAAVMFQAKSADGSLVFNGIPNFTWQYADDPATQRDMVQENQGGIKVGLKPCPVIKPTHAADFLRDAVLPKLRGGKRIVGIDPLPEFNQILRQRLGLPPDTAGAGAPSAIRTDAARARLEYDLDGQTVEEWLTTVVLVRIIPSARGNVYDCHAVMMLALRAPKGKLDGNDRLFKLMSSTIHPEPKWQGQVNAMISQLYQKKQIEEAKRSAIIATFQQHVAQTINEVTANQIRGADQSAAGMSQIIRGVQTFRNPATGGTFELSNQFDHAWLNGSNEYIMSDDPNFNPNGSLNGNWTSLQPVRPQP